MKVVIVRPRLDCTFKEGPVPEVVNERDLPPIRVHWRNFADYLTAHHLVEKDDVHILHMPLWQLPKQIGAILKEYKPDCIYIPHKGQYNLPIAQKHGPRYYMQTVFPWLFTIDPQGWGYDMSQKILADGNPDSPRVAMLKEKAKSNQSKFGQPDRGSGWTEKDFIFFACQIPHDETIKYHSEVSVLEALRTTIAWTLKEKKTLVVKGHPVNTGSQFEFYNECKLHDHVTWTEDTSIFDLMEQCEAMFCVNSGSGIEALIYHKPVFHFGDAEYEEATCDVYDLDIATAWKNKHKITEELCDSWLDSYVKFCYDTTNIQSFKKLETIDERSET